LVSFPFIDVGGAAQAKPRPAVVISGRLIHQTTADVLIAAISSRPASQPLPTDYQIVAGTLEAQLAGVKMTCWVKTSNLAAVPKAAITRRLGSLSAEGLQNVEHRLRLALELP
jgi:mRNA-degrading endonuclease toxin of MazEF toxin-antitoxin module